MKGAFSARMGLLRFQMVSVCLAFVLAVPGNWLQAGPWVSGGQTDNLTFGEPRVVLTEHEPGIPPTALLSTEATPIQGRGGLPEDSVSWLAASADADSEDRFIVAKLTEIGTSTEALFGFVRDRIAFESYAGSLRGARGTLWSEAGNSLDQASLLIALLRAAGHGARYVRGTLADDTARELIRSMFDPVVAAHAVGYIPERYRRSDPERDSALLDETRDHWWVELEDGTQLDPCFAGFGIGEVATVAADHLFEVPDELRHKVTVRLEAELHNMLSQYSVESPLEVTFGTGEIYGKALTLGHFINTYQPPSLIGGFKTYTYSPYLMVDDNDADLWNNHLIRGTDYQEFLTSFMPLANSTLTRLTLEFTVQSPGGEPDVRRRDVLDRVGFAARHGLAQPTNPDTSLPALNGLDLTTCFVLPGLIAPGSLVTTRQALEDETDGATEAAYLIDRLSSVESRELSTSEQQRLGRAFASVQAIQFWRLMALGQVFLRDSDEYARFLADRHLVHAYHDTPRVILTSAITALRDGEQNASLQVALDLRRNLIRAVPFPGQNAGHTRFFNLFKGLMDNRLELSASERVLGSGNAFSSAASSLRIWREARQQGIEVVPLLNAWDIATRLESLDISSGAKARIAEALGAGLAVNVPAQMAVVDGRPQIAWYESDPRTGEIACVAEDGTRSALVDYYLPTAVVAGVTAFGAWTIGVETIWTAVLEWFTQLQSDVLNELSSFTPTSDATLEDAPVEVVIETDASQPETQCENGGCAVSFKGISLTGIPEDYAEFIEVTGPASSVVEVAGSDVEMISLVDPGVLAADGSGVSTVGMALEIRPDSAFVVKHNETQVASAFRARLANTGDHSATFALGGTPPAGWRFLWGREEVVIPANTDGAVSVFLQPQEGTPLPAPGASLDFVLEVTRTESVAAPALRSRVASPPAPARVAQARTYVMPEVHRVRLFVEPAEVFLSPNGSSPVEVVTVNMGNVEETVALALPVPEGFAVTGLDTPFALAPGESRTHTVSIAALDLPTETDAHIALSETYGPDDGVTEQEGLTLHVVAPGAHQAGEAARDARAAGRGLLGDTLATLALDLSALYAMPEDAVLRARVTSGLAALIQQLEDPLLAPFAADLDAARLVVVAASAAGLPGALEGLGLALNPLVERLRRLADHDFTARLSPNSMTALPETPTDFKVRIDNHGGLATTYRVELGELPPGITGEIAQPEVTVLPGQSTAGSAMPVVTLTQPASELTAFMFPVTISVVGRPEVTRTIEGAFEAREEWVKVLAVEADPAFLAPFLPQTSVGVFTGGDVGEGLDLDGEFPYAVNVGTIPAPGLVRDADFTAEDAPGVAIAARSAWNQWNALELGDSVNDNRLEQITRSVRWQPVSPRQLTVDLTNTIPGQAYALQLLFNNDDSAPRAFDVWVDGRIVADDFHLASHLPVPATNAAVVLRHEFFASTNTLHILLDGTGVTNPNYTDHVPLLNGLTLELLTLESVVVSARLLNAVNSEREVLCEYTVEDSQGTVLQTSPRIPVTVSPLSSIDPVELGRFVPEGLEPGVYPVTVMVYELDGTPIPGTSGEGNIVIGTPLTATLTVDPVTLPPGGGRVSAGMRIATSLDLKERPVSLIGLTDTPGTAQTIALHGDHAYVGGTENLTILDVSDPRNPRVVGSLGEGPRWATLAGDHLFVLRSADQSVEMYGLDDPAAPVLLGSTPYNTPAVYAHDLYTSGSFAFANTLVVGVDSRTGALRFVRGDLLSFDLSNPAAPQSLGLLYNTSHTSNPGFAGSAYFMGTQSAVKKGVLYLTSSTGKDDANGGTGRLILVDATAPGTLSVADEILVPGTTLLAGIGIQGNRALVVGSTSGFAATGIEIEGDIVITTLDVSDPWSPTGVGTPFVLTDARIGAYSARHNLLRISSGTNGWFFLSGLQVDGQDKFFAVDAMNADQLRLTEIDSPTPVTWTEPAGQLLYATSTSGLAVYDLGGLIGIPVTATVQLPQANAVRAVADSFDPTPDSMTEEDGILNCVWNIRLSATEAERMFQWQADVTELAPGESREVARAEVSFAALGLEATLPVPAAHVTGGRLLELAPARQTVQPATPADYTLSITNITDATVVFAIELAGVPANWVEVPATASVPAHGQTQLALTLLSEAAAAEGDYSVVVRAVAAGMEDSVGGGLQLLGPARQPDGRLSALHLELQPVRGIAGPGSSAEMTVRATQVGNVGDRFQFSIEAPPGVHAVLEPAEATVLPGVDNFRDLGLRLTPDTPTAPGLRSFLVRSVSLDHPDVSATVVGELEVVAEGVTLDLQPGSGAPGTPFTLTVRNTGQVAQAYDLEPGGPLAPMIDLPASRTPLLPPGATHVLALPPASTDHLLPGATALLMRATAVGNPLVIATTRAEVVVPVHHAVEADFDPGWLIANEASGGTVLFTFRNAGNVEDVFRLSLKEITGPFEAALLGLDGTPDGELGPFRLPALSSGAVALQATAGDAATGKANVAVGIEADPEAEVTRAVELWSGCRLELGREWVMEMTYDTAPDTDHFLEYKESVTPGTPWEELPGGPYNRGYYLLCVPRNCDRFTPDPDDPVNPFLESGVRPQRYYRIRVAEGSPINPRMRLVRADALRFNTGSFLDHVVQITGNPGDPDAWTDLPNAPHNGGLVIFTHPHGTRFYRVKLVPATDPDGE